MIDDGPGAAGPGPVGTLTPADAALLPGPLWELARTMSARIAQVPEPWHAQLEDDFTEFVGQLLKWLRTVAKPPSVQ